MDHRFFCCLVSLFTFLSTPLLSAPQLPAPPWAPRIDALTGLKGTFNEKEGVYRVKSPRTEIVNVDGVVLPPEMGLTSWASFTPGSGDRFMVLGHLILFQDEVNATIDAVLEAGLSATSLHHHFFYDEPRIYGLTVTGDGGVDKLAKGMKTALQTIQGIRAQNVTQASSFGGEPLAKDGKLNLKTLQAILGNGKSEGGVFKVTYGRSAKVPCNCLVFKGKPSVLGLELTKDMGVSTTASFIGSDENAIVHGHFAVTDEELQKVLKSLRSSDFNILGIEQRTITETPRLVYVDYWARGKADALATAVKTALAETSSQGKKK
jgi:Domain of Unknown Function (DUF1259)